MYAVVIRSGGKRIVSTQNHLWKLANQPSASFAHAGGASIPRKVRLHWPQTKTQKSNHR
jgi:hypothetical protein